MGGKEEDKKSLRPRLTKTYFLNSFANNWIRWEMVNKKSKRMIRSKLSIESLIFKQDEIIYSFSKTWSPKNKDI